ncbi:MAG TPA: di-heme oxidoredictase family protein [Acidimicrobiales bacterium]
MTRWAADTAAGTVDTRGSRRRRLPLVAFLLAGAPLLALVVLVVSACSSGSDDRSAEVPLADLLATDLGGTGSTSTSNRNAFSLPNRSLPGSERGRFEVGDSFFTQKWVIAPASTTSRDGLGPLFNAEACASCHVLDGRAEPPDEADPKRPGLLFRLSVPGFDSDGGTGNGPAEGNPDPNYGGQLQDKSIPGVDAEGSMGISYVEVEGTFDDGTPYSLLAPTYTIDDPAYGPVSDGVLISPRIAPATIGMGLLEAVPEEQILAAAADPDDTDGDGDGISGRPNRVVDPVTGEERLGRFGWKANVASVAQQTAGAFHGDLGVTSPVFPNQDCSPVQLACQQAIAGGDPEVDERTFESVVFYTRVIAVPKRRPATDGSDAKGAELFARSGCASCHTPTMTTGDSDVEALANQTIHAYTDLLLHDMGEGLADGRPDGEADGQEWRTAPLWGIGLTETVNGHTRFLHDGRARNLTEAILWHGGEAEASKRAFLALNADQRAALIAYLETL